MARIALLILVGLVGNQLYKQYRADGRITIPFVQDFGGSGMAKCVTQEGETLYSNVPAGVNCAAPESVDLKINTSEYPANLNTKELDSPASTSKYSCDGRQHCSQMRSCAEAIFFLENCPGTKMDGDGDSVPCERQWCN